MLLSAAYVSSRNDFPMNSLIKRCTFKINTLYEHNIIRNKLKQQKILLTSTADKYLQIFQILTPSMQNTLKKYILIFVNVIGIRYFIEINKIKNS